MNEKQQEKSAKIIRDIVSQYPSIRAFARTIGEDTADITKWKAGRLRIKTRAVVTICKLHPDIKPHDLRPDWFPENLNFTWR